MPFLSIKILPAKNEIFSFRQFWIIIFRWSIQQGAFSFRPGVSCCIESRDAVEFWPFALNPVFVWLGKATGRTKILRNGRLRLAYFQEPVYGGWFCGGDKKHITAVICSGGQAAFGHSASASA